MANISRHNMATRPYRRVDSRDWFMGASFSLNADGMRDGGPARTLYRRVPEFLDHF
jgi:hypothetical protein